MQTNYVPSFTKSRVLQTMIIVRLPSLWMNLKLVTLRTKATWLRMVKIISSLVWSAGNYFSNILTLRYNTARWLDIQYEGLSRRCLEINFFFSFLYPLRFLSLTAFGHVWCVQLQPPEWNSSRHESAIVTLFHWLITQHVSAIL